MIIVIFVCIKVDALWWIVVERWWWLLRYCIYAFIGIHHLYSVAPLPVSCLFTSGSRFEFRIKRIQNGRLPFWHLMEKVCLSFMVDASHGIFGSAFVHYLVQKKLIITNTDKVVFFHLTCSGTNRLNKITDTRQTNRSLSG